MRQRAAIVSDAESPRSKAPVAIVFTNLKGNVGDFAILHSMLLDIGEHFPDHPVHVYHHGFLPVDQERLEAFSRLVPAFTLAGATSADIPTPNPATVRLLRKLRLLPTFYGARIRALATSATPQAARFSQYQAVCVAGGAQWTGAISGVAMFGTLRAISAHTDRIFGYPFSVSSSLRKMNRPAVIRQDLARIRSPLIARDSATQELLESLGLEAILGADCVFSLAAAAAHIAPSERGDTSRTLFVVTGQKPGVVEAMLRRLEPDASPIALLTTCEIEDAPALEPVAKAANVAFLAPLTWQETVAEMKASALVVSNRLHGFILSSFAGVPVLPLVDRPKLKAVVNDAGLTVCVSDLEQLDTFTLRAAMAEKDESVARIAAYRDHALLKSRSPFQRDDG